MREEARGPETDPGTGAVPPRAAASSADVDPTDPDPPLEAAAPSPPGSAGGVDGSPAAAPAPSDADASGGPDATTTVHETDATHAWDDAGLGTTGSGHDLDGIHEQGAHDEVPEVYDDPPIDQGDTMALPTPVNGQITDTLSQAILGQQAAAAAAVTELQVLALQQATAHSGAMNQLRELMLAALIRRIEA